MVGTYLKITRVFQHIKYKITFNEKNIAKKSVSPDRKMT